MPKGDSSWLLKHGSRKVSRTHRLREASRDDSAVQRVQARGIIAGTRVNLACLRDKAHDHPAEAYVSKRSQLADAEKNAGEGWDEYDVFERQGSAATYVHDYVSNARALDEGLAIGER